MPCGAGIWMQAWCCSIVYMHFRLQKRVPAGGHHDFVGFGFLMTFLKHYSYSALGLNFFCSCIVILEALLVVGAVQQVRCTIAGSSHCVSIAITLRFWHSKLSTLRSWAPQSHFRKVISLAWKDKFTVEYLCFLWS
jgi:hypothetical protein